jgi:N-acetylmuramoyl-L-alanine amidase
MRFFTFIVFLFSCFSLIASPPKKAVPKSGEGIYSFLTNHGYDPKIYFDEFIELNKSKLGRENSLIKNVSYTLPASSSQTKTNNNTSGVTKREPLFGKKYAEYTVKSDKLKGATFFLSSGHGGPDCGAIGKAEGKEIHEDEYAYDITLRLARSLMMEGATVHMIIQDINDGIRDDKFLKSDKTETCRGKKIPLNQKKRLQQRCDEINVLFNRSKDKYKRAVFIHLDSRSTNQQMDVFFYHHAKSAAGKELANTMRKTLREQYHKAQPNRGFTGTVSSRELHVLNNSTPVGLFAELGNIRNSKDQQRFLLSSNRQALADWMCLGFIADYQNSKK